MGIVSYAQNFEDVMLWRALGHIENGFYIDVGANDPVVDSVSLVFHQRGWKGIHVEPMTYYAELLRQQRPGDQIIQAAIGNEAAIIRFYEISGEGISTGDPDIAQQHRERGFQVNEIRVPAITLNAILESCDAPEVHWMKIDVEGFEKQVITSWAPAKCRPWVVVVESTLPMTQIPSYKDWESTLTGYGYKLVYFDGLNRYYLSGAHPELKKHFSAPPNVFDDFTLNGTAHAPFHRLMESRYHEKITEIETKSEAQQEWARNEIDRISQLYAAHELQSQERESTLKDQLRVLEESDQAWTLTLSEHSNQYKEQVQQVKQELEMVLRAQVQREQELTEELLTVQRTTEKEKQEVRQHYQELTETIQREYSEHEWLMTERIEALNNALRQVHEEKALREQEYSDQLRSVLPKIDAEETALHEQFQAQLDAINREKAEHDWLTGERIFALNEAMHQLQSAKTIREQELYEQILNAKEQADREKSAIHQHYQSQMELVEREQAEHQWLTTERIHTLNETIQELQAKQTEREQEHNRQLLESRHQAESDKAALREYYQAKMGELQHVQGEHEWLTAERINDLNQELHKLRIEYTSREQLHIESLHSSHQKLTQLLSRQAEQEQESAARFDGIQRAHQIQIKNIHLEHEEKIRNINAHHNEDMLKKIENVQLLDEKIGLQQQLNDELQLSLNEISKQLTESRELEFAAREEINKQSALISEIYSAFEQAQKTIFYKITKPMQKAFNLLKQNKNLHAIPTGNHEISQIKKSSKIEIETHSLQSNIVEPMMQKKDTPSPPPALSPEPTQATIKTAGELLMLHDKHFVNAAYKVILNRQPDPEGFEYYLRKLRSGTAKKQILAQLSLSREGKSVANDIPGIIDATRQYKRERYPIIGWLFKMNNPERGSLISQQLREINNNIFILKDDFYIQFKNISDALVELQKTQRKIIAPSEIHNEDPSLKNNIQAIEDDAINKQDLEQLNKLTEQGKKTFIKLKLAMIKNPAGAD